jgi:hypothetical protein
MMFHKGGLQCGQKEPEICCTLPLAIIRVCMQQNQVEMVKRKHLWLSFFNLFIVDFLMLHSGLFWTKTLTDRWAFVGHAVLIWNNK